MCSESESLYSPAGYPVQFMKIPQPMSLLENGSNTLTPRCRALECGSTGRCASQLSGASNRIDGPCSPVAD
jgi:hypothetical protein